MNGSQEILLPSFLQAPNRLQVLNSDAFHVLSASGVDIPMLVFKSFIRVVGPVLLKLSAKYLGVIQLWGEKMSGTIDMKSKFSNFLFKIGLSKSKN